MKVLQIMAIFTLFRPFPKQSVLGKSATQIVFLLKLEDVC